MSEKTDLESVYTLDLFRGPSISMAERDIEQMYVITNVSSKKTPNICGIYCCNISLVEMAEIQEELLPFIRV